MDQALIGLAGIVVGTALGGTGKYGLQRRDAWREARMHGLLLLADVRALREAPPDARVVSDTELGARSWESHREVLAAFRRGTFPNGFKASEWLELAGHFAHLEKLYATGEQKRDRAWWNSAQEELAGAERLLAQFEFDPGVLGYVLGSPLRRLKAIARSVTRLGGVKRARAASRTRSNRPK